MFKKSNNNEIIAHQWDTLKVLWQSCKMAAEPCKAALQGATEPQTGWSASCDEIDKMFPQGDKIGSSDAEAWREFNYAEQRVGQHLAPPALNIEYLTLLGIAEARKSPWRSTYLAEKSLFENSSSDPTALKKQQALYQSLLQALQADFIETRFRRRLRRETAGTLLVFGIIVLLVAVAPICFPPVIGGHGFYLLIAACFGMLGAYFSRMLSFQTKLASIGFDDVMNLYAWRMLAVRLLFGIIGAIIFFYLLYAGLLGGDAFPDMKKLGHQAAPNLPEGDFAKLLVWLFLAGFSERLVPDSLERAEAQSKAKDTGSDGAAR